MTEKKEEIKIEVAEKDNFEDVTTFQKFSAEHSVEAASLLVQIYSKIQGVYIGHSFECNLLLFRQEMARWNYKKIEQVNNEVARFPKEHGLVILGYINDDNKVVAYERRTFINIYDMLTNSQKLDYEDFQKALQALKAAKERSNK